MILSKEIFIKITQQNFSYYDDLGYDISIGEALLIPIALLSPGSNYKISCKCDECGIIKEVIYKNYIKYGNKWGDYLCRKCSEDKRKNTLLNIYGVEYPIQNKDIMKKRVMTIKHNKKEDK